MELDEIIEALRFVAQTGCPELGRDARVVMAQYYQHHRRDAWAALSPDEQEILKTLMR